MFIKLIAQKLRFKWLSSLLCILLMAIGVLIISLVGKIGGQLERNFSSTISKIDMVVGAKGSPLQLILSSVFHIDSPTGNISLKEAENNLKANPMVKTFIPLALGDNFKGFRIVGSTPDLLLHYQVKMEQGKPYARPMQAIIGSEIAQKLNLKLGDKFAGSHGLHEAGEAHHENNYTVTGILKPSGTVLDKLIMCDLESIWEIHAHKEHEEKETRHHEDNEITAALIRFKSPLGLMTLPRLINKSTNMQAALPAIEINRLLSLFSSVVLMSKYLAGLIILVSGLSVFISLYNSLKEEKNEKALMLTLGAGRAQVFGLLLVEGLILSVIGYLSGLFLARCALYFIQKLTEDRFKLQFNIWPIETHEIYLLLLALSIGIISAAIPSLGVYRLNLSKTLAKH